MTRPSQRGLPASPAVRITWLGNAGFLIAGAESSVLVDPYLSAHPDRRFASPVQPSSLPPVAAVLATHEHADHLDLPTWRQLADGPASPIFVLPEPVRAMAIDGGIPATSVVGARPFEGIDVGSVKVTPIPSRHGVEITDAYDFGGLIGAARYLGYVIELDGVVLYHAGDTVPYDGQAESLANLGIDVALLPINGRDWYREREGTVGNLTEREAAALALAAHVRTVVPMHYELFARNTGDVGRFVAAVAELDTSVSILVPALGHAVPVAP